MNGRIIAEVHRRPKKSQGMLKNIMIVFFVLQKQFAEGITGSVK